MRKQTKFEIKNIEFTIESKLGIEPSLQQEIYNTIMQPQVMMFQNDYSGEHWIFDRALITHDNLTLENVRITFLYDENDKPLKMYFKALLIENNKSMAVSKEIEKTANLIVNSL